KRRNPSPLFDINYYLEQNQNVAEAGVEPLTHYLTHGWKERRNPSPLFDISYYFECNPDVAEASLEPLTHYLSYGWKERRNPSSLFDINYYFKCNPDVAEASLEPLTHYLSYGWREGRNPSAGFKIDYYLEKNPSVQKSGAEPLTHYYQFGDADGLSPAPRSKYENIMSEVACLCSRYNNQYVHSEYLSLTSINCSDNPVVSVIIYSHDSANLAIRSLLSLAAGTSLAYEVILVDDDSDSEWGNHNLKSVTGIKYVKNEKRLGILYSINKAIKFAIGQYVLILNNGAILMPGCVDALYRTFHTMPRVGVAGAVLLKKNGLLKEAGGYVSISTMRVRGTDVYPESLEYMYAKEVDYCSGYCFMVNRDLLVKGNGMDESYVSAYLSDKDLCIDLKSKGLRVVCQPFSRVIYTGDGDGQLQFNEGIRRNRSLFHKKWASFLGKLSKNDYGKQALVVDFQVPAYDQNSGALDTYLHISFLQEMGYHVTFIPYDLAHRGRYTRDLQSRGVRVVHIPEYRTIEDFLCSRNNQYEIIITYRWEILSELYHVLKRTAPQAKLVFITVDLHSLRELRLAELCGDRAGIQQARQRMRKELQVVKQADISVVCSSAEKAYIQEHAPNMKVELLPPARPIPGRTCDFNERNSDIVFVGGFKHKPNVDGVQYFLDEVWPFVAKQLPDTRFIICGSYAETVFESKGERIVVRGYVEDLSTILNTSRMSVFPLRYGAGVKGKVLTSMSYGLPCVSSSIAMEGTRFEAGIHFLLSDAAKDFADKISTLYSDGALWTELSDNGLTAMKEFYSIDIGKENFRKIIEA
ncbi:MAG: glycosyltransferase, partial [Bacteroides sp.]|nr:glycosyltransferase [Bacteroides sp.]